MSPLLYVGIGASILLALIVGIGIGFRLADRKIARLLNMTAPAPRVVFRHPAHGRFCHICGADAFKGESCDAGLHS